MIKYRVVLGFSSIEPVEVSKETGKSVWIRGRRQAKESDYASYHDTWDAASERLLMGAAKKLDSALRMLEVAEEFYGTVKGLKKPEGVE